MSHGSTTMIALALPGRSALPMTRSIARLRSNVVRPRPCFVRWSATAKPPLRSLSLRCGSLRDVGNEKRNLCYGPEADCRLRCRMTRISDLSEEPNADQRTIANTSLLANGCTPWGPALIALPRLLVNSSRRTALVVADRNARKGTGIRL